MENHLFRQKRERASKGEIETCNNVQKHRRKRAIRLFRKEEMGNKAAKLAFRGIKKVVNPGNSLGVTEHKNERLH